MRKKLLNWLINRQKPCFIKEHTGHACPGCGMQTAIIELLKGDFKESFSAYPALIPLIFTLLWLFVYIFAFKFKKGKNILLILIIIDFLLIIGHWVLNLR